MKSKVTSNIIVVLERSKAEIKELRGINQRQADRLSGFDDALKLLNAHEPHRVVGMSECVVSRIDSTLRELKGETESSGPISEGRASAPSNEIGPQHFE